MIKYIHFEYIIWHLQKFWSRSANGSSSLFIG